MYSNMPPMKKDMVPKKLATVKGTVKSNRKSQDEGSGHIHY